MQQQYPAPNQVSDADLLRFYTPNNTNFGADPAAYKMNNYGVGAVTNPQYDTPVVAPSTQIARRSLNRQLVPTAQRNIYDNSGEPWAPFGDDSILDPQNNGGRMEENDNIELLEEKAAVAKRDAQSKRKQIPPFVQKLSSFLDDGKNTELIRWSERGDSFVVLNEDEFAKKLIPELFKHNNYASFVRQLNMYGFHKRVGLSDNSMKASERNNKSPSEYYNPYFKRGHPNLLWLINKPKGGNAKNPKGRKVKDEDGHQDDSDDDGRDGVEHTYGPGYGNNIQGSSRALSAAPESGPLQRREIAVVQKELADIQKNQAAISQAITRLRKDHNQLYQQAVAFQTLHDRHESSINAILTFLATVYDRSLNGGQGARDIAQMFADGIPQQQPQGNVVDIGDLSTQQQQNAGNVSPHRRQRLLMAPPNGARANTISPASTPNPTYQQNTPRPGAIEELFDASPSDTTHLKVEPETPQNDMTIPQQDMMDIINNTNAQSAPDSKQFEFPEMLSHYENANGNSPLTPQQRNTMLNMIASQTSAPGNNNALVSPVPPQYPGMDALAYTDDELARLAQLQNDISGRLDRVNRDLAPLSPTGSIPGIDHSTYFNGGDVSDPGNSNLDLDQYLDTGAFYNGSSPMAGSGEYNFDTYGGDPGIGESHFDLGMDGAADGGRIIETANSSEVNTPETVAEEVKQNGLRSPTKRRRKN